MKRLDKNAREIITNEERTEIVDKFIEEEEKSEL